MSSTYASTTCSHAHGAIVTTATTIAASLALLHYLFLTASPRADTGPRCPSASELLQYLDSWHSTAQLRARWPASSPTSHLTGPDFTSPPTLLCSRPPLSCIILIPEGPESQSRCVRAYCGARRRAQDFHKPSHLQNSPEIVTPRLRLPESSSNTTAVGLTRSKSPKSSYCEDRRQRPRTGHAPSRPNARSSRCSF